MTSYLLLRDNKESGPYSFEELKQKGLKAYDLVWVEGKSAAWRYPSELDEFKSFAPAVEEQPFDRFFKKPAQQNAVTPAPALSVATESEFRQSAPERELRQSAPESEFRQPNPVSSPVIPSEPSSIPGKRIIYVTLPAGKPVPSQRPPQPSLGDNNTRFQPTVTAAPVQQPVLAPVAPVAQVANQSAFLTKEPGEPRESGSRTELLSNRYVPSQRNTRMITDPSLEENLAQEHVEIVSRSQNSVLKRILQPVAASVVILALVAAGIFIGLTLNRDSFGFLKKISSKGSTQMPVPEPKERNEHAQPANTEPAATPTGSPVTQASSPVTQTPDPNTQTTSQTTTETAQPKNNAVALPPAGSVAATQSPNAQPAATIAAVPPVQKRKHAATNGKPTASDKAALPSPAKDSSFSPVQMTGRQAIHRSDVASDKETVKSNIANLVSVSSNTYNVGTFGGISDLQVTVSNRSIYPLDLVVVEIEYIQANKKVYKTEDMYFRGVGPGAALMQEAPKTSRGIKVQYKITLINSKDLNLSFSAL